MHPPEPSNILNRLRATYRRRRTPKDEKCICSETSLARNPVEKSLNCRLQRKYTDHGQQQCGLFKKLPPEIRNAIYAELFALEEPLALKFVVHSKKKFKIRCAEASWLLAFPKTCWQAYLESIQYVYSANTFQIDHPGTLSLMPFCIAPPLLASIQSLRLCFSMNLVYQEVVRLSDEQHEYKPLWGQGWSVVSKLQGLKTLDVRLARSVRVHESNQKEALRPLRMIKGLDSFVVVADEHLFESAIEGIEATFIGPDW